MLFLCVLVPHARGLCLFLFLLALALSGFLWGFLSLSLGLFLCLPICLSFFPFLVGRSFLFIFSLPLFFGIWGCSSVIRGLPQHFGVLVVSDAKAAKERPPAGTVVVLERTCKADTNAWEVE